MGPSFAFPSSPVAESFGISSSPRVDGLKGGEADFACEGFLRGPPVEEGLKPKKRSPGDGERIPKNRPLSLLLRVAEPVEHLAGDAQAAGGEAVVLAAVVEVGAAGAEEAEALGDVLVAPVGGRRVAVTPGLDALQALVDHGGDEVVLGRAAWV